MITLSIQETAELQECRRALQRSLAKLDKLGAGLAAIHVNAAIEQLTSNLEAIGESPSDPLNLDNFHRRKTPKIVH